MLCRLTQQGTAARGDVGAGPAAVSPRPAPTTWGPCRSGVLRGTTPAGAAHCSPGAQTRAGPNLRAVGGAQACPASVPDGHALHGAPPPLGLASPGHAPAAREPRLLASQAPPLRRALRPPHSAPGPGLQLPRPTSFRRWPRITWHAHQRHELSPYSVGIRVPWVCLNSRFYFSKFSRGLVLSRPWDFFIRSARPDFRGRVTRAF